MKFFPENCERLPELYDVVHEKVNEIKAKMDKTGSAVRSKMFQDGDTGGDYWPAFLDTIDCLYDLNNAFANLADHTLWDTKQELLKPKPAEQKPTKPSGGKTEILQGKTPTAAEKTAYDSFKWVCDNKPDLLSKLKEKQRFSVEMYEVVKEHCPLYGADEGEQLPSFESWKRYIRAYEQYRDGPKNTPRAGRGQPTGVKPSEIQSLSEVTSTFNKAD